VALAFVLIEPHVKARRAGSPAAAEAKAPEAQAAEPVSAL
jgi:hypothetical protein